MFLVCVQKGIYQRLSKRRTIIYGIQSDWKSR